MNKCFIHYDNNSSGFYKSGDTISGVFCYKSAKKHKISYISLTLHGYAKTKWIEIENILPKKFGASITILNEKKYLECSGFDRRGNAIINEEKELPQGLIKYRFSFQIPDYVPSSLKIPFDGDDYFRGYLNFNCFPKPSVAKGWISYSLKAEIKRAWNKPNIKMQFPLTIIKHYDLNLSPPNFRTTLSLSHEINFGFSSKKVQINVKAPVTGFITGETAYFRVYYMNQSNQRISQTRVQVIRTFQYNDTTHRIMTREEILSCNYFKGCKAKSANVVYTPIRIPSVTPSSDGTCTLVSASYKIEITPIFDEKNDFKICIPIIIGTIPYNFSSVTQNQLIAREMATDLNPQNVITDSIPPPKYDDDKNTFNLMEFD